MADSAAGVVAVAVDATVDVTDGVEVRVHRHVSVRRVYVRRTYMHGRGSIT